MGRHRAARLATVAVGLSMLSLAPFARFAHASTLPEADTEAVTGPIGVLMTDPGAGSDTPPVVDQPTTPPPTGGESPTTPDEEPTTPTSGAGKGPVVNAPAPASAVVRLPGAELAAASPHVASAGGASGAARSAPTGGAGEGMSLEDLFLRGAVKATPQAVESAGRSALPIVGSSSLPAMLFKSMLAVLGMLFLAGRRFGSSLSGSVALGRTLHRRNAPRGWKIVVTTPLPQESVVSVSVSALERPVLEPLASGAR